MQKAIRVSVLLLVFTCSSQAGVILTPPAPQPPPPQTETAQEPEGGVIHNPLETEQTTAQIALDLLQSALALL